MATTFNGTGLPGVVRRQQWSAFGQFAGPPLVAWVASSAGGWQWTWLVTGLCAATDLLRARQVGRQLERQQERLPHAEAA